MANERRIRTSGRPMYGRPMTPRPQARRSWRPHLSLIQRRLLILAAVAAVGLFAIRQLFAIRTVTVVPSIGQTALVTEVHKSLKVGWWQGNTLTFNGGSFAASLKAADPSVKAVATTRVWPGGLRVIVTLNQPSLGWLTGNQGYLIDTDGTVIGLLPTASTLPVIVDDSNLPITTGQTVVAPPFVAFVKALSTQLPAAGLTATKYEVKDTTLDLYVTTNRGFQLILDTSRPAADEVGDLKTVLANLKATGKTPAQYVDLRIAGRAYYK